MLLVRFSQQFSLNLIKLFNKFHSFSLSLLALNLVHAMSSAEADNGKGVRERVRAGEKGGQVQTTFKLIIYSCLIFNLR